MSDLVLSLDTSTPQLSAALLLREGGALKLLSRREIAPPTVVSTQIPAVFDELFEEAGESRERLGLLVSGVGPGLFTGIRVAMATMKALAYALKLPLLGAQSLEALSLAAARGREAQREESLSASECPEGQLLCPVLDARRGEVYFALYRSVQGRLVSEHEAKAGAPLELAALLKERDEPVQVFGSGVDPMSSVLSASTVGEAASRIVLNPQPRFPAAAELAALAIDHHIRADGSLPSFSLADIMSLEPTYLRPPEAQIARERRLAKEGR